MSSWYVRTIWWSCNNNENSNYRSLGRVHTSPLTSAAPWWTIVNYCYPIENELRGEKLGHDRDGDPGRHQNLINFSLGHAPPLQKFVTILFWGILHTDKHTDCHENNAVEIIIIIIIGCSVGSNNFSLSTYVCICNEYQRRIYTALFTA